MSHASHLSHFLEDANKLTSCAIFFFCHQRGSGPCALEQPSSWRQSLFTCVNAGDAARWCAWAAHCFWWEWCWHQLSKRWCLCTWRMVCLLGSRSAFSISLHSLLFLFTSLKISLLLMASPLLVVVVGLCPSVCWQRCLFLSTVWGLLFACSPVALCLFS